MKSAKKNIPMCNKKVNLSDKIEYKDHDRPQIDDEYRVAIEGKRQLICLQIHNDYLIPGGETKSARLIADLLELKGIRVIRYYKNNDQLASGSKTRKFIVGFKSVYNRDTVRDIQKILDENHVDFALIHNTSPMISNSVYGVLSKNGVKIYKYLQNYNLMCLNGALDAGEDCVRCMRNPLIGTRKKCYKKSLIYSLQKFVAAMQMRWHYLSKIDCYIAISNFVKNKHVTFGIPEKKIKVIYHFCDAPARIVSNRGAQNDNRYIIYMGRLSREKGILTLVEAVASLPAIDLKILGKGEMEEEIRGYIRENNLKNIEFLGYKTGVEKDNIVGNALALVAPSEWEEPFGRIVIEAYQVGTPVVASALGGMIELVDDGVTGYTFVPGNVRSLREKLEMIWNLSDDRIYEMREACVELVNKEFSANGYFNNFQKLIQDK